MVQLNEHCATDFGERDLWGVKSCRALIPGESRMVARLETAAVTGGGGHMSPHVVRSRRVAARGGPLAPYGCASHTERKRALVVT